MESLDENFVGWLSLLENEPGESFSEWSSESREKRGMMAETASAESMRPRSVQYQMGSEIESLPACELSYWLVQERYQ
jgi:hypothetical protein